MERGLLIKCCTVPMWNITAEDFLMFLFVFEPYVSANIHVWFGNEASHSMRLFIKDSLTLCSRVQLKPLNSTCRERRVEQAQKDLILIPALRSQARHIISCLNIGFLKCEMWRIFTAFLFPVVVKNKWNNAYENIFIFKKMKPTDLKRSSSVSCDK